MITLWEEKNGTARSINLAINEKEILSDIPGPFLKAIHHLDAVSV